MGRENIPDNRIIPFTLQLLIENVTKHNVINKKHEMLVKIVISQDHISVSNPIIRCESKSGKGIGLQYISSLYNQWDKTLNIENDEKTFSTIVPFINLNKEEQ